MATTATTLTGVSFVVRVSPYKGFADVTQGGVNGHGATTSWLGGKPHREWVGVR